MAIIDVIKYEASPDVYVWKYPSDELGTWTQLIVNESQEAILFKNGQAFDLFKAGRHTLSTNNIPLLSSLINLPFGGKSPFKAEVWYINKLHSLDIKWGTREPINLQDPQYKIIVPVRSFGQFGIEIIDSRKFLLKLVGPLTSFDKSILIQYFRGLLMTKFADLVSSYFVHKKISLMEINAYIDEISKHMQERITPMFEEYGIKLLNFYVNSINFPEDDSAVLSLKHAFTKRAEMDILGYSYHQERSFNTIEAVAKNKGTNSDLLGVGMGIGMGAGLGGVIGRSVGQAAESLDFNSNQLQCEHCLTRNNSQAKFCMNCGESLETKAIHHKAEIKCSKCGELVSSSSNFCPGCGHKLKSVFCSKCGFLLQGSKFCPECGSKEER